MTATDSPFEAWQKQQEVFWSGLLGGDGQAAAREWFAQWSRIAGAPAGFAQTSVAEMVAAPFRAAFGNDGDLQRFMSFHDGVATFGHREMGEEDVRRLSDYWVGLLHLPTSRLAVEQALIGLAGMRTAVEVWRASPLVPPSSSESWEKIYAGWQATLQSYKGLLDLYEGYGRRVAERLIADLDGCDDEVKSLKELFDHWVRAAEGVHDEIAATGDYQQAFGQFVNHLCLTIKVQRETTDGILERIGVPTYSELTDVHARIERLRKEQRRLRNGAADLAGLLTAVRADLEKLGQRVEDDAGLGDELRRLGSELGNVAAGMAAIRSEVGSLREVAESAVGLGESVAAAQQEIAQLRREMEKLAPVADAGAPVDASPSGGAPRRAAKPKRKEP